MKLFKNWRGRRRTSRGRTTELVQLCDICGGEAHPLLSNRREAFCGPDCARVSGGRW